MKEIIFGSCGFITTILPIALIGCASLGVATVGVNYFNGKAEADLVRYFKYDGEDFESNEEYDKVLYFTNLTQTVYVDKTTVKKFKNRTYNEVLSFNFYELYDGCLIYPGTVHHELVRETKHVDGKVLTTNHEIHRNNTKEIHSKIKSFNSLVQQYGAVERNNDNIMFERTSIGNTYYIYDIQSNRFSYSDNKGSGAIDHKYNIQAVSVFEDSNSSTETHIAYIYTAKTKQYTDEKGNQITASAALENKKTYLSKGFKERKKDKGLSLIAYIKDGKVVKAVPAE